MHALDILGDPVRRRILELLANASQPAGDIVGCIQSEFGITQSAVSQHLRILRDSGFTTSRPDGPRRIYMLNPAPLAEVDQWLNPFRRFWEPKLLALETEIARGKHNRANNDIVNIDSNSATSGASALETRITPIREPPT